MHMHMTCREGRKGGEGEEGGSERGGAPEETEVGGGRLGRMKERRGKRG